jgi:hypothetical protein
VKPGIFALPGKSGGGPPHSKTLARPPRHPNRAKRLGVRWPSSAFEREHTNHAAHPITPMVATPPRWPGRIKEDLRRQFLAMRQMVTVPTAAFIL